jgi:hypothetical protein
MRIVFENLLVGPAIRQKFHQELHGNTCPLDDRLAYQHLRVHGDAILQIH